jgi:hypothetical protein
MKTSLFISWSGNRSQKIAEKLRDWLPLIIESLECWVSSTDLMAGQRWTIELAKKLEKSNIGIIVITHSNKSSPWLLFEAGALSKSITEGRVIPCLVGLKTSELDGPLSQFQANYSDRDGTYKLTKSINSFLEHPTEVEILTKRFDSFWPQYNEIVKEVLQSENGITGKGKTEIISKDFAISKLQDELIIVKEMVNQLVRQSVNEKSFLTQTAVTIDDESIESIVGSYRDEDDNSHLYIQVIDGKIVAPYCYQGNNTLDAEYYDWKKIGEYWLTKYRWIHKDIQGFALYKLEDEKLVGNWWGDDKSETKLSDIDTANIENIKGGTFAIWAKDDSVSVPKWAASHFKKYEKSSHNKANSADAKSRTAD